MESVAGKKVFVGLSGGVDSAVTAALLQQVGAHVVGVFIKGWYPPGMPCTWSEDRRDAMRAAARLQIPFHTLDASQEYKRGVIDYLLREYAQGRTPNPDIMCNREVKFGAFWRFAKEHGADFIATGHYARTEAGKLLCGVDTSKDQSYFLWAVPKEAMADTLFPLGEMDKQDTRRIAAKLRIPQAAKKDSQGICFLGSISVDDFLRGEIGAESGPAVDVQGAHVGVHGGAVLATLGERVSLLDAPPGPWYVHRKDMSTNTLVVSHQQKTADERGGITITETNWFNQPKDAEPIEAQYRYHGPRVPGVLAKDGKVFVPTTVFPEQVAPGQSLVLYRGEELLGGGIIA